MKVEKETFIAMLTGALVGLCIPFLGSYIIGQFYLIVHLEITISFHLFGIAAWYFYISLIICAIAFIGTELYIEHYQLEVLFKFIVPFLIIELNMHVFTFIYMLLFGFNLILFVYMHVFLIMIFILSLPAILFYVIYDKLRDPSLFLGIGYGITILISLLIHYITIELAPFSWFKFIIISAIYGVAICAVVTARE